MVNNNFFSLHIISPEGIIYREDVSFLSIQTSDFKLGIMPNHYPLIAAVVPQKIEIRKDNKNIYFQIEKGVLHIKKENNVFLFVDSALSILPDNS